MRRPRALLLALALLVLSGPSSTSASDPPPLPVGPPDVEAAAPPLPLTPPLVSDGPRTPILDDFNRQDEDPLSQGGAWAPYDPRGPGYTDLPEVSLTSVITDSTCATCGNVSYRTRNFPADFELYATVAVKPADNQAMSIVFNLREEGSHAWDAYYVHWKAFPGTDRMALARVLNHSNWVNLRVIDLEYTVGDKVMVRRLGSKIEVWVFQSGTWTKRIEVVDGTLVGGKVGFSLAGTTQPVQARWDDLGGGSLPVSPLLDQYAPELRFTADETYRADSAEIAAKLVVGDHITYLERPDGSGGSSHVASADPASPLPDLSLDYLGTEAHAGDYLKQPNHPAIPDISAGLDYRDWVRRHPEHRRIGYGRVLTNGITGEKLLQYWMYYYYNSKGVAGIGFHEGDWEVVQVRLSSVDIPTSMTISQHGDGEKCFWGPDVDVSADGRPIIYVALDSPRELLLAGKPPILRSR